MKSQGDGVIRYQDRESYQKEITEEVFCANELRTFLAVSRNYNTDKDTRMYVNRHNTLISLLLRFQRHGLLGLGLQTSFKTETRGVNIPSRFHL